MTTSLILVVDGLVRVGSPTRSLEVKVRGDSVEGGLLVGIELPPNLEGGLSHVGLSWRP